MKTHRVLLLASICCEFLVPRDRDGDTDQSTDARNLHQGLGAVKLTNCPVICQWSSSPTEADAFILPHNLHGKV
jgi:hypothetical protein